MKIFLKMTEEMQQSAVLVVATSYRERVKHEAAVLLEKKNKLARVQTLHDEVKQCVSAFNEDIKAQIATHKKDMEKKQQDIQLHFDALATNSVSENMLECMKMIEGLVHSWLKLQKEFYEQLEEHKKNLEKVAFIRDKITNAIPGVNFGKLELNDVFEHVKDRLKMAQDEYNVQVQVANDAVLAAKKLCANSAENYDREIQELQRKLAAKKENKERCSELLAEIE